MRAIITGMNGTVAPAVARHLRKHGHESIAWDRSRTPTDDPDAIRRFITEQRPDWFFHVATGSPDWAEAVARVCGEQGIRFLFTSSVSVFANTQQGPFTPDATPQPNDDYGAYKLECERRVRGANAEAIIARLAWQIGDAPGSNNMVDYLERTATTHGRIDASASWVPACAFLQDTAASLHALIESYPADLYQLDANPGLSFFEIATRLNRMHGERWRIEQAEAPAQNNRMLDDRIAITPITERLAGTL
jgi:dTDP-4-dehydrorhamnose reductase